MKYLLISVLILFTNQLFSQNELNNKVFSKGKVTNPVVSCGNPDACALIQGWIKESSSNTAVTVTESYIDANGNIYTTGFFEGTMDFNPNTIQTFNLTSNGRSDIFVQKLNAQGSLIWAASFGDADDDRAYDIITDNNGGVYLTGFFEGLVDFDPGLNTTYNVQSSNFLNFYPSSSNTIPDGFILKLNSNGNFVWVQQFGSPLIAYSSYSYYTFEYGNNSGRAITIDNNNNVYITGFFEGGVDFDADPNDTHYLYSTYSYYDYADYSSFVLKLNAQGGFIWAEALYKGIGYDIVTDGSNNVLLTGFRDKYYSSYTESDSGHDIAISKLDANGNIQWEHYLGNQQNGNAGYSIAVDNCNNVFIGGDYKEMVDFDPSANDNILNSELIANSTSTYSLNNFVLKLNAAGQFEWVRDYDQKDFNATGNIELVVTNDANIIAGTSYNNVIVLSANTANPITINNFSTDIVLQKFDNSGNSLWYETLAIYDAYVLADLNLDANNNLYAAVNKNQNALSYIKFNYNCNNADADGDGVPDNMDLCNGFDDSYDEDYDGIPDGCDYNGDDSCTSIKLISNNISSGAYKADNAIISDGIIASNNVSFKAGNYIRLENNFSANPIVRFTAKVEDCN